jgi:glycosyltransferase involved in cell wall biosynthesis
MQKSKINILFLTYRADKSGGPLLLLNLLKDLNTNGQRSQFSFHMGCPIGEALSDDLRKTCEGYVEFCQGFKSILSFFFLISYCRKNSIQLIHSHGRGAGYFSRFLNLFGFKVIHSLHGVHVSGGWKSKIKGFLEKLLAFRTNAFVVSSYTEDLAGKWFGFIPLNSKSVYIPHKLDFIPKAKQVFQGPHKVMGTLTRLEPEKGNIHLLEFFFKYLKDQNWSLQIAGQGSQKDQLLTLIKEYGLTSQVELAGFVTDKNLFLNQLDVYVSFSESEGMPLSVIEAMGAGIPCLLSSVRGHIDFNERASTVWTFEKSDYLQCFLTLKMLVDDTIVRTQRILRAQRLVKELSELKWEESYYKLYFSLVELH